MPYEMINITNWQNSALETSNDIFLSLKNSDHKVLGEFVGWSKMEEEEVFQGTGGREAASDPEFNLPVHCPLANATP